GRPPRQHGLAPRRRRAPGRLLPAAVGVPAPLDPRGAGGGRARGHDHHAGPAHHRPGHPPSALLRPRPGLRRPVVRRRPGLRALPGAMGVNVADVVAAVLVVLAVLVGVLSCIGVLMSRNAYDSLHYTSPASVVSPVLLAIAVVIEEGIGSQA